MRKQESEKVLDRSFYYRLTCGSVLLVGLIVSLAACSTPPSNRNQSPNATKSTSSLDAPLLPGAAYTNLDVLQAGGDYILEPSFVSGPPAAPAASGLNSAPLSDPALQSDAPPLGPVKGI